MARKRKQKTLLEVLDEDLKCLEKIPSRYSRKRKPATADDDLAEKRRKRCTDVHFYRTGERLIPAPIPPSSIVTLLVGPDKIPVSITESALTSSSPFFTAALEFNASSFSHTNKPSSETTTTKNTTNDTTITTTITTSPTTKTIHFPTSSLPTIHLFAAWAKTHTLSSLHHQPLTTTPFTTLNNNILPIASPALITLYLFTDCYSILLLRNQLLHFLTQAFLSWRCPNYIAPIVAYANSSNSNATSSEASSTGSTSGTSTTNDPTNPGSPDSATSPSTAKIAGAALDVEMISTLWESTTPLDPIRQVLVLSLVHFLQWGRHTWGGGGGGAMSGATSEGENREKELSKAWEYLGELPGEMLARVAGRFAEVWGKRELLVGVDSLGWCERFGHEDCGGEREVERMLGGFMEKEEEMGEEERDKEGKREGEEKVEEERKGEWSEFWGVEVVKVW